MSTLQAHGYEKRLRPSNSWWNLDLHELASYSDLALILVRRDFLARYAQSVLGPAWFVVLPLLTTLVFTFVFGGIAKVPTDGVPPFLFFLCNQVAWNYFANTFTSTSTTFSANQALFSKVYFPRLVVPAAGVLTNGITFLIQLTTFAAFLVYYKAAGLAAAAHLTWVLVCLPLVIAHLALLGLFCGLWMASLTAKYRDLVQVARL